jgi:hypothetical protein
VYLNGVVIWSAVNLLASPTIQSVLSIGSMGGQMGRMNGTIGEVAVYDRALTTQQVASHYAAGAAPFFGILDRLGATAAGAYSLRRLLAAWQGPSLTVRRDLDSTTADISFTWSGRLDTAALLTFVGAGNGYVARWYDQAGSAPLVQA